MFAVYFCTTHGKNRTHKFDTEGFIPVESLCGLVGFYPGLLSA